MCGGRRLSSLDGLGDEGTTCAPNVMPGLRESIAAGIERVIAAVYDGLSLNSDLSAVEAQYSGKADAEVVQVRGRCLGRRLGEKWTPLIVQHVPQ